MTCVKSFDGYVGVPPPPSAASQLRVGTEPESQFNMYIRANQLRAGDLFRVNSRYYIAVQPTKHGAFVMSWHLGPMSQRTCRVKLMLRAP
jgi:hypothetical protein